MKEIDVTRERLSFLEYAFCLMIVWGSGTLFTSDFPYVLYGMVIIFIIMIAKHEIVFSKHLIILSWITVFMLLSMVQNLFYSDGKDFDVVIKNFLIIYSVILFALNKPTHNILRIRFIINTIIVISIFSNLLYLYHIFGPGLPLTESIKLKSLHYHYLFSSGFNTLGIGLGLRNGGIYWEPGMYQVYLTFALLFYLYYREVKYRLVVIIYLVISTISTFSVSAYAVMAAILGVYVIRNNTNFITKILIAIAVVIAFHYAYPLIDASMEAKQETGSYEARSNDLAFGIEVFKSHPILGCGIVNEEYANASFRRFGEYRYDSNGMVNLLINMGLVGFFVVASCILSFGKWAKRNISPYVALAFAIWIIISSNTEPIVFHPFFEYMVGVGAAYWLNNKKKIPSTNLV